MSAVQDSPETSLEAVLLNNEHIRALGYPQRRFLVAFAQCGNITRACREAHIHRNLHYEWMSDPAYQRAFAAANEASIDAVEDAVRQRGVYGVRKPVLYQGKQVMVKDEQGVEQPLWEYVYSDTCAIRTLEAKRPADWKPRIETTTVWDGDLNKLTESQLRKILEQLDAGVSRPAEAEVLRRLAPAPAPDSTEPIDVTVSDSLEAMADPVANPRVSPTDSDNDKP